MQVAAYKSLHFRAYAMRGNPSASDRFLASKLGLEAIEGLLEGKRNAMVGIKRNEIHLTPLNGIKRDTT